MGWRSYRTKSKTSVDEESTSNKKLKNSPLIAPGSEHHNDLQSFLKYAKETGLKETSTVYVGTHYEYTVRNALHQLGFSLTRTGRGNDYGIDLLGHWSIPSLPADTPLRVLVQCKARSSSLTPNHIRELEGAFPGAPAGWRGEGVLGLLVATREASRGIREALIRSNMPLGFVMVTADDGKILQFIWNYEARQRGLEGMGVTNRYLHDTGSGRGNGDGIEREIALTWNGWALKKVEEKAEEPKKARRSRKDGNITKKRRPQKDAEAEVDKPAKAKGRKPKMASQPGKRPRGRPKATTKSTSRKKKS
jgi:hypothetical protein